MNPSAYRKQVEQEVEEARTRAASAAKAMKRGNDPASRKAAIEALGDRIIEDDAVFAKSLGQLGDKSEDPSVRMAVLNAIHLQNFSSPNFQKRLPEWLAALRGVIEDPDAELRLRAIGILSNHKDAYTQEALLKGLRDPKKALVPAETALELLSNDVHAELYPIARAIADKPPSDAVRIAALRLLAAAPESTPLFEKILRDRKDTPEARRLAIAALSTIAPSNLRKHAREIVLTEDEDADVLATSLAALAHDNAAAPADLSDRVDVLLRSRSAEVKLAAGRLRDKMP